MGIFFKNGKDAAKALNKKWDEIENWWNSKQVMSAKIKFKKHFSLYKTNVSYNLGKLLKDKLENN